MRDRLILPSHGQHLGNPTRGGGAYPAQVTHESLDKIRPATDVREEIVAGLLAVVGDDDAYARAKHGHGTPPEPIVPHTRFSHGSAVGIVHGVETVVSFANQVDATVGGMKNGNRAVTTGAGVWTVKCGIKWDFQNLLGECILHVINPADGYVFIDDHITFPVPLNPSENTTQGTWTGVLPGGVEVEARVYQRNSAAANRSVVSYFTYPYFSLTYGGRAA